MEVPTNYEVSQHEVTEKGGIFFSPCVQPLLAEPSEATHKALDLNKPKLTVTMPDAAYLRGSFLSPKK